MKSAFYYLDDAKGIGKAKNETAMNIEWLSEIMRNIDDIYTITEAMNFSCIKCLDTIIKIDNKYIDESRKDDICRRISASFKIFENSIIESAQSIFDSATCEQVNFNRN